MDKIPNKVKYTIYGISLFSFLVLNFGFAQTLLSGLINFLSRTTPYQFILSTNLIDYLLFSIIPVIGLLYNSNRIEYEIKQLIQDVLTVLFFVIIVFAIGLYLMTFIDKDPNPLVPQSLLIEPFSFYSTILIGIGAGLPYTTSIFSKRTTK